MYERLLNDFEFRKCTGFYAGLDMLEHTNTSHKSVEVPGTQG